MICINITVITINNAYFKPSNAILPLEFGYRPEAIIIDFGIPKFNKNEKDKTK